MSLFLDELTPRGGGAVTVLRLSGPAALARARALAGRDLAVGALTLARLGVAGEDLDEALLLVRGEREVELHIHGSPVLVARLRAELGEPPPAPASGTLEDRAARLVGEAASEAGARILLDQASGALRRRLEAWEGLSDAELVTEANALAASSRAARRALEPARVVLVGPANAGKSTLFNALVGRERVLVHGRAGTTRDLVVERAWLGPWPVDLVDTAGERELTDAEGASRLEREGQRLARTAAEGADLVLRLVPPGGCAPRPAPREMQLGSQGDRAGAAPGALSALADPAAACELVTERFREALELPRVAWTRGLGLAFDAGLRAALAPRAAADLREVALRAIDGGLEGL